MLEERIKAAFIEAFPVYFSHAHQLFRRLEFGLAVRQRESVVGADILTNVAAVHPAFESLRVVSVEAAFVFDGEIGDTLSGIDVERGFQSTCGTGIEAFGATSAAVG